MTYQDLLDRLKREIVILDGSMGVWMQQNGMPAGVCPEEWYLNNPSTVAEALSQYVAAGASVIYTPTLGANPIKLKEYGLEKDTFAINRELAALARRAAEGRALVAGDISMTGEYVEPFGELRFEEAVRCFRQQIEGLIAGGVDLLVIETMMDIQEARAAMIAAKETCALPVWVTMSFSEDGRTLTGTDPATAAITLQSLGADAAGCNCSAGPDTMVSFIEAMKPFSKVPLIAKPNAGLPCLQDGRTVFDMDADTFAGYCADLAKAGANLIGGCCGTNPAYIQKLSNTLAPLSPVPVSAKRGLRITSAQAAVTMGAGQETTVIGERINPTGKKDFQQELRAGRMDTLRQVALDQVRDGASVLDVNVGMGGVDEAALLRRAVCELAALTAAPLCIDTSDPAAAEAALRVYPGRALLNSISLEPARVHEMLPVAAKYGAALILLPLDDTGIPETVEHRIRLIEKLYETVKAYGYEKEDILIDGLAMAVSAEQDRARQSLETIRWVHDTFQAASVIGLSNISFGLPRRGYINAAFLAMAIESGLTAAIANPGDEILTGVRLASDVLCEKDGSAKQYVRAYAGAPAPQPSSGGNASAAARIADAILTGDRDGIAGAIRAGLDEGMDARPIMDDLLIPALTRVGDLFEQRVYFLPQLIRSAEAMEAGVAVLEPYLAEGGEETAGEKPKIVIATVQGDIHDIGKNIVALMLRNHGFTVIDLGKNVPAATIVEQAQAHNADIVALSALMTTTMERMEEVIGLIRQKGLSCKVMVGGAVVTQAYADQIGADGYSEDATQAVKCAKILSNIHR